MAASRYTSEGFFFFKVLNRERDEGFLHPPVGRRERRRRIRSPKHRQFDEETTGSLTRPSL